MRRLVVLMILCACALPASVAHAWTWPVNGPVLRPFSFDRAHPYAAGQHRGVDLGAQSGTAVRAPAAGVVSFAGTVPTGGKTVSIQTSAGYTLTLVHLGSIGVQRGAEIAEGAVVGTVGPSGQVDLTEPFVYFGARVTGDDQGYVDPLSLLPARQSPAPASVETSPSIELTQPAAAPVAVSQQPRSQEVPAAPAPAVEAQPEVSGASAPVLAGELASAPTVHRTSRALTEASALPHEASAAQATPDEAVARAQSSLRTAKSRRGTGIEPPSVSRRPVAEGSHGVAIDAGRGVARSRPGVASLANEAEHGRNWLLPGALATLGAALLVVLCLRPRRRRFDTLPIMNSGEQVLHHDTDLLRQLDASHRPRVHDDRGRHPRAPHAPAR